ncbi:hypothetical protein NUW58_g4527 [Xylaria curta]|uniref:Uncharacterized protein n=1 Tax=Xylaria curta TaxID=42375 RepID=A0ACC1P907_9PEZI|nr:hypothetical protein NUW58_g4527 [Xylaria curta]
MDPHPSQGDDCVSWSLSAPMMVQAILRDFRDISIGERRGGSFNRLWTRRAVGCGIHDGSPRMCIRPWGLEAIRAARVFPKGNPQEDLNVIAIKALISNPSPIVDYAWTYAYGAAVGASCKKRHYREK